ncbi:MAG TPA: hypothetical protein VF974_06265 [Patescibacteria group bacterium]
MSKGAKSRDDSIRRSCRAQTLIAQERARLAELTGLSNTELQWIDDHFLSHQLWSTKEARMRSDCIRAEVAYRDGKLLPLMSHLRRLMYPERARRDENYQTEFYDPAELILDKLKKKLAKE